VTPSVGIGPKTAVPMAATSAAGDGSRGLAGAAAGWFAGLVGL
jgi:hypothetical protein